MTTSSPSDFKFGVGKETIAGTIPASPTIYHFPHIGGMEPKLRSDAIASQVVEGNRASAGQRRGNFRVEDGIKSQLRRSPVFDLLWESALGGTWATNTLKAGKTDTNLFIQKEFNVGATPYWIRWKGCQVKKASFSVQPDQAVEVTYEVLGMDQITDTVAIPSAVPVAAAGTTKLIGRDTVAVTVGGFTAPCMGLEFSVEHNKEHHPALTSDGAIAIGTDGPRRVVVSGTFYRQDLSAEVLFAKDDTAVPLSFTIGSATNGYRFTLPAAQPGQVDPNQDGSKDLVTIEFIASYDATALTDFFMERLT